MSIEASGIVTFSEQRLQLQLGGRRRHARAQHATSQTTTRGERAAERPRAPRRGADCRHDEDATADQPTQTAGGADGTTASTPAVGSAGHRLRIATSVTRRLGCRVPVDDLCWRDDQHSHASGRPVTIGADVTASDAVAAPVPARPARRRPGRRRGTRGRASAPGRSRPRQGLRDRPGDPDGRPDHARGRRTPRARSARCAAKAMRPDPADPTCPPTAAVCVYPDMVGDRQGGARRLSGVHVASVATAFPSAAGRRSTSSSPTPATRSTAGADEIDMVIDRGAFLSGRYLRGLRRDRRGPRGLRRPRTSR